MAPAGKPTCIPRICAPSTEVLDCCSPTGGGIIDLATATAPAFNLEDIDYSWMCDSVRLLYLLTYKGDDQNPQKRRSHPTLL